MAQFAVVWDQLYSFCWRHIMLWYETSCTACVDGTLCCGVRQALQFVLMAHCCVDSTSCCAVRQALQFLLMAHYVVVWDEPYSLCWQHVMQWYETSLIYTVHEEWMFMLWYETDFYSFFFFSSIWFSYPLHFKLMVHYVVVCVRWALLQCNCVLGGLMWCKRGLAVQSYIENNYIAIWDI